MLSSVLELLPNLKSTYFASMNPPINAQENRAKRKIRGHSRKPNLPSFSVYREVLTSLQTSYGLFSQIRPIFGII